jgi:F0F1-type ATP synthase gamma subunit
LRFSICKDEKEYREMVTQWWKFARPNDKKVRRTKESHYLSDEERNQITVDLIEKIAGESAAAIYVLTNNHYSALTNETQIQQFSSEYGERQESMRWRHFGGEILSYEFWLRAHIENVKSEVAEDRQSDWIKSVDATQFFAEDIRVSR